MDLKNSFTVVTGASGGIGRAIALELGKQGTHVGLIARSEDKLRDTKELIEETGGLASFFPLDLRNIEDIYRFAEKLKTEWGHVNILVNVAGIYHDAKKAHYNISFIKYTVEEIKNTYDVGTNGTTFLTHAVLPLMPPPAHIVNISGTFENGAKGWLPYFVSKRAIEDFTVGLSQDIADQGIFVNCISPSDTATEAYKKFFPEYYDEAMDPKKIGEFIVDLCQKDNPPTGKVFVLKKDTQPREAFHV